MTGPVFVDTNVFVYLHDDSEPQKKTRADEWISLLVREPLWSREFSGSAGTLLHSHKQAAAEGRCGRGPINRTGTGNVATGSR